MSEAALHPLSTAAAHAVATDDVIGEHSQPASSELPLHGEAARRSRILRPLPPPSRKDGKAKRRSGHKSSNRVAPEQQDHSDRGRLATQLETSPISSAEHKPPHFDAGRPAATGPSAISGSIDGAAMAVPSASNGLSNLASHTNAVAGGEGGVVSHPVARPMSVFGVRSWDLCLIVDSDKDTVEAKKEIRKLFALLKKEGVMLSEAVPLDATGWEGRMLSLATATQAEFEEEAEIMGLSKPLVLSETVANRFQMSRDYGRVTAPFTVAKRSHFHPSPFVIKDRVLEQGAAAGQDNSGLEFFSPCERQFLLEHMTENKIRQLIRSRQLSPHTAVTFFPLHETIGEDGKKVQGLKVLEFLQDRWATPWRKERYLSVLRFWEDPSSGTDEPLNEIRSYFGEQIAIYFAFLSFYTRWLVFPAIVGLGLQIWSWSYGFDNLGLVICCAFICLWSALFIKYWERKQSVLSYYWFTKELNFEEKVRREFYLAMDKFEKDRLAQRQKGAEGEAPTSSRDARGAGGGGQSSMVRGDTGSGWTEEQQAESEMKAEDFKFPLAWRAQVGAVSVSVITVLLSCVAIIFVYMYLINVVAAYTNCEFGMVAGSVVHACCIIGMGWVYRTLAVRLNERENHRTEEEYENHFILKIFLFEFANNFLSMIWIAFLSFRYCSRLEDASALLPGGQQTICLLDGVERCEEEFRDNVITELQTKLGSLFLTRLVVSNIIEAGIVNRLLARLLRCFSRTSKNAASNAPAPVRGLWMSASTQSAKGPEDSAGASNSGVWKSASAGSAGGEAVGSYQWWIEKGKTEAAWPEYGDGASARTVDDYNEIVMQFCFVCLFGVAFPITGLLALISNLVELVVDSRKLCFNTRRPFAQRASSIPDMWLKILKCVALFGVVTNIVIVLTNSTAVTQLLNIKEDGTELWTAMFVFEHVLVALIVIFWQVTPTEPHRIRKLRVLSRRMQRALQLSSMAGLDSGEGHDSLFHLDDDPNSIQDARSRPRRDAPGMDAELHNRPAA